MRLTRRALLGSAAAGALAAAGVYELVDRLADSPPRPAAGPAPPEQHLLDGIAVVVDNDVEVLVPPLHHQVVTATLRVQPRPADLKDAAETLEDAIRKLESRYDRTPAGLGVTVAWGMPYFDRYVPRQAARHLPVDLRATATQKKTVRALADAIRFPSDPSATQLEENHVAVLLRSDHLDHVADGAKTLFTDLSDIFRVTSIRKGFVGGGFHGSQEPSEADGDRRRRAGSRPDPGDGGAVPRLHVDAEAGLGPARIANFETLGFVDLGPSAYFAHGTSMHLSHLFENLEAWYLNFDHRERVDTTFRPGLDVDETTLTVPQGPDDVQTPADVSADYHSTLRIGHSGSIQTSSRLPGAVHGPRRDALSGGDGRPSARGLQHARQPVLLDRRPRDGRLRRDAGGGAPFRRLQPVERRLRAESPRDGRRAAGRDEAPLRAELTRPGLQRRAPDDAPAELPRAAARPPVVPARRAPGVTAGGSSLPEVQSILTSLARSRRCAEAGTAFGEGAAALARTAASVVTVEIDPDRVAVARSRLSELPNVELFEGDWQELLPLRAPYDLFFLDAGGIKQRPEEHLPQAVELLAPGGVLFSTTSRPAVREIRRARHCTRTRSSTSSSTSFPALS